MTQTYVYPIITTVFVIAMFTPFTQQQAYAQTCESAEQEELQRRYTGTITVLEGMFDRAEAESETVHEQIQTSRDDAAAIRPLRDLSGVINSIRATVTAGKVMHRQYLALAEQSRFASCGDAIEKKAGDILGYMQQRSEDMRVAITAIQSEIQGVVRRNPRAENRNEEKDMDMRHARTMCEPAKRTQIDRYVQEIAKRSEDRREERQSADGETGDGAAGVSPLRQRLSFPIMNSTMRSRKMFPGMRDRIGNEDDESDETQRDSVPMRNLRMLMRQSRFKNCIPYVSHKLRLIGRAQDLDTTTQSEPTKQLFLPKVHRSETLPSQNVPPSERSQPLPKVPAQPPRGTTPSQTSETQTRPSPRAPFAPRRGTPAQTSERPAQRGAVRPERRSAETSDRNRKPEEVQRRTPGPRGTQNPARERTERNERGAEEEKSEKPENTQEKSRRRQERMLSLFSRIRNVFAR